MKNLLMALGLVCVLIPACSQEDQAIDSKKVTLQNLNGTYASTAAEDWGNGTYGMRTFTFDKGKWSLKFSLALDPGMQSKVFEFRTYGNYKVLEKSKTVTDAYDALFYEEKKFVTLRTGDPGLTAAFGLASCGLTKDVEKDISIDGCSIWKPVAVCGEDHDLLSIDATGKKLYFGVRPADNDMCTANKRPKALLPAVTKQ